MGEHQKMNNSDATDDNLSFAMATSGSSFLSIGEASAPTATSASVVESRRGFEGAPMTMNYDLINANAIFDDHHGVSGGDGHRQSSSEMTTADDSIASIRNMDFDEPTPKPTLASMVECREPKPESINAIVGLPPVMAAASSKEPSVMAAGNQRRSERKTNPKQPIVDLDERGAGKGSRTPILPKLQQSRPPISSSCGVEKKPATVSMASAATVAPQDKLAPSVQPIAPMTLRLTMNRASSVATHEDINKAVPSTSLNEKVDRSSVATGAMAMPNTILGAVSSGSSSADASPSMPHASNGTTIRIKFKQPPPMVTTQPTITILPMGSVTDGDDLQVDTKAIRSKLSPQEPSLETQTGSVEDETAKRPTRKRNPTELFNIGPSITNRSPKKTKVRTEGAVASLSVPSQTHSPASSPRRSARLAAASKVSENDQGDIHIVVGALTDASSQQVASENSSAKEGSHRNRGNNSGSRRPNTSSGTFKSNRSDRADIRWTEFKTVSAESLAAKVQIQQKSTVPSSKGGASSIAPTKMVAPAVIAPKEYQQSKGTKEAFVKINKISISSLVDHSSRPSVVIPAPSAPGAVDDGRAGGDQKRLVSITATMAPAGTNKKQPRPKRPSEIRAQLAKEAAKKSVVLTDESSFQIRREYREGERRIGTKFQRKPTTNEHSSAADGFSAVTGSGSTEAIGAMAVNESKKDDLEEAIVSSRSKKSKNSKIKGLIPPKSNVHASEGKSASSVKSKKMISFSALDPKPRDTLLEEDVALITPQLSPRNNKSITEKKASEVEIINQEFCSACHGDGDLICCETCPKSFHFTCVDPPIDPENVPEESWFCNECLYLKEKQTEADAAGKSLDEILTTPEIIENNSDFWSFILEKAKGINPKHFVLPKRFRKPLSEHGPPIRPQHAGVGVAMGGLKEKNSCSHQSRYNHESKIGHSINLHSNLHGTGGLMTNAAPSASMVISPPLPGSAIPHPKHRDRTTNEGFCFHCNRSGQSPHRSLLRCDQCSLLWHLDCLPYPMATNPGNRKAWICPLHLSNEDSLLDLQLGEETIDRILLYSATRQVPLSTWNIKPSLLTPITVGGQHLIPESSIRLHFGFSLSHPSNQTTEVGVEVPAEVKTAYEAVRHLSVRQAKIMQYYNDFNYKEQSVEVDFI